MEEDGDEFGEDDDVQVPAARPAATLTPRSACRAESGL